MTSSLTGNNGWVYTQHTRAGGKTVTRTQLDRVGVRRLLFYIEKQLRQMVRNHQYSGDDDGWLDFEIFSFLSDIQDRKGVCDYEFATNEKGIILGILPQQNLNWIWILLEIGK